MSILTCANCQRPNPDFLDNCQYCGKPLREGGHTTPFEDADDATVEGTRPFGQPVNIQPEDLDIPDWLKNAGDLPALKTQPESAGDVPDWLKAATGPLDAEQPPAVNTGDLPDWLRNATGQLAPAAKNEPTGPIQEDVPDWLKSLGGGTGPMATPAKNEPTGPIQEDVPDWLKSMGGGTGPMAEPAKNEPTGPIQEDVPDWLKSMGGGTGPVAEPAKNEPTGPIQEDVPDWLKSMGGGTGPMAEPAAPEESPAAGEELPDWLMNATGQLPAGPAAPVDFSTGPIASTGAIEEDVPDWLKSMGGTGPMAEPAAEPAPEPAADWLATPAESFAAPAEEPAPLADDMPDWLKAATGQLPAAPAEPDISIQEAAPDWMPKPGGTAPFAQPTSEPEPDETPAWLQAAGDSAPAPAPSGGEELPDWLRLATSTLPPLPEAPPPAAPEPPKPVPGLQTGELPDWLKTTTGPLDTPAPPVVNTGELPDWLKAATGPLTPPGNLPPAPPAGDLPDWMKNTGPLPPAVQAAPEISAEPQPDWLNALEQTGDDLGLIGAGAVAADITLGATETPAATPAGDEPDWLRALQSGAPIETGPLAQPASAEPGWLTDLRTEPEVPAATAGEEPDWMAALRPAAKAEPQSNYVPPADLTQGELPNWLSALRPVDAGAQLEPEQDAYQETVGVLSGMRGVLRAEPSVVLPGKTATQVHALDVSDEQNQQANLFLKLLQADNVTTSTKPKAKLAVPLVRWLITAVLLVGIIAPMFPQFSSYFPTPVARQVISTDVEATFNLVEALPSQKPVLVAFEYEAGQQGELGLLAESVLTHLMRRGIRLVGISTSPTGAAVGQLVFSHLTTTPEIQARTNPYIYTEHYVHLGYLPGGPVGIAQFVRSPQSAAPVDFNGQAQFGPADARIGLWQTAPLRTLTGVQDFGAVVVLAATPESARIWFEQTEAARNLTTRVPMIFVTSASAAPLVRPYFEAERGGFISGPTAIMEYESRAGTVDADYAGRLQYWDMTGAGALLTGLILVLGNLLYGLRQLWRKQRGTAA